MAFDHLTLDHPLFSAIDCAVYVVIFLVLVSVLRVSQALLAKSHADDRKLKSLFTAALLLVTCGLALSVPEAARLGQWIAVPIALFCAVLVNQLCWVPPVRSMGVVLIFFGTGYGLLVGAHAGLNRILPEERQTLVQRINIATGLLEQFAGREGEEIFTKETLSQIKTGLAMNREAWTSAIALLQDPESFEMLVAEHTDDLRALGLIVEGEVLTEEDLAELGIVYEEGGTSQEGLELLQAIRTGDEVSPKDVDHVMSLLRSVRTDGSTVTPNDAVAVIGEAMRRHRNREQLKQVEHTVTGSAGTLPVVAFAGAPTEPVAVVSVEEPPAEAAPAPAPPTPVVPPPPPSPWEALTPGERMRWMSSKSELQVTGIFHHHLEGPGVAVNGTILNIGDEITVEKNGDAYRWKLTGSTAFDATWDPVLPSPDIEEDGKGLARFVR